MLNVEELLSVSEFEATGDTTQLLAPDLTNLSQVRILCVKFAFLYKKFLLETYMEMLYRNIRCLLCHNLF